MQAFNDVALELHKAKQTRKYFEMVEKQLLDKLLAITNHSVYKGTKYELQAKERLGSVNYSIIPELRNVNVNLYRKESTVAWHLVENIELPNITGLELK